VQKKGKKLWKERKKDLTPPALLEMAGFDLITEVGEFSTGQMGNFQSELTSTGSTKGQERCTEPERTGGVMAPAPLKVSFVSSASSFPAP
jgi:hypothetical protein